MGLRESFDELDSGAKVLVVVAVGFFGLIAAIAALVIFAAILGTFVLSLGSDVGTSAPQASFSIQGDGGTVEVVHSGGDAVSADNVLVQVNGQSQSWATRDPDTTSGDTITAGDALTLSGLSSGDVIQVRWKASEDDVPTIFASHEVP